jgi:hypothetical protein
VKTVFVGDVGTEFILDCGVDVSEATVMKIIVAKPCGGPVVEWPAVAEGPNAIKYKALAGDLDVDGIYCIQAYIEMPGWSGSGEAAIFEARRKVGA